MVAVAIGAAAVVGAGASVVSGNKAANAQTKAADQSIAEQQREYDQSRADLAPYRDAGGAALSKLSAAYGLGAPAATDATGAPAAYGGFETSPGYEFRRDEGLKAIDRGAAARGLLGSGAAVKAEERFADNTASSEFGDWWNRLAGVAGVGQAATNTTVAAGQNTANNISSAYTNAGNARASSYANTGAAINNGVNNIASAYLYGQGGGFGGAGFKQPNAWGISGSDGIY